MTQDTFLGLPPSGWSAISSFIAAAGIIGAAVTIFIAYRQFKIAHQTHENQTRPYVIVDFESNPASWHLYDLVIRNIGSTPAYDVSIEIDPTPIRSKEEGQHTFADARVLNETTPMIAPNREIRLFFDSMFDRRHTDLPSQHNATVRYTLEDRSKTWTETSILDLDLHKGASQVTNYGIHHAAKALRDLEKTLRKELRKIDPLEVVVEDREIHIERRRKEHEQRSQKTKEINEKLISPNSQQGEDKTSEEG